jgi:hypothetical protein
MPYRVTIGRDALMACGCPADAHDGALDAVLACPGPRGMTYDEQLIHEGACPEIVPVLTEDGPTDGRCLAPIVPGGFACPGHTEAIEAWRAMSEPERAHWERQHDEF